MLGQGLEPAAPQPLANPASPDTLRKLREAIVALAAEKPSHQRGIQTLIGTELAA